MQVGLLKWRKVSGVICDRKVPTKLKGKFYCTTVRPIILYGSECWALKGQQHKNKVGVVEMRMLRWMCDNTRQDKIRNDVIWKKIGVAPIEEKITKNQLKWFGHVQRRSQKAPIRRMNGMTFNQGKRERGILKRTLEKLIKGDLILSNIFETLILNCIKWHRVIHVADLT